jgi:hypothetical protein
MSYIFNNKIAYSDSPNLDAFGRLRIAAVTNLLDIKHVYDKNPLQVNEVTAGTATSVFSQQYARVRMSVSAAGDFVIRQSKTHPIYQPGKSQLFEGSLSNFQIETNVIKRVGSYTSTTGSPYNSVFDGFFLESNGVTSAITFNIYLSGSCSYSADTSTWDSTQFDVNNFNWNEANLMTVDYQWLGVGRMRFGMVLSGQTIYFLDYTAANNIPTVYMSSPNQPIRYEIRSSGGTGYLDMICSQTSTEGALNGLYSTVGIQHSTTATLGLSGTKYSYIGYRLKQGFKSVTSQFNSLSVLNTSNDNSLITIEFNPTLSYTPTWVDIPDSPFQYSLGTGGTQTISSSGYVTKSLIAEAGTSALTTLVVDDNQIRVGSNVDGTLDEMWINITPLGANATFLGTAEVLYYL